MLRLDFSLVESHDGAVFEAITRACAACSFRKFCEFGLKRDFARTRQRWWRYPRRAGGGSPMPGREPARFVVETQKGSFP